MRCVLAVDYLLLNIHSVCKLKKFADGGGFLHLGINLEQNVLFLSDVSLISNSELS